MEITCMTDHLLQFSGIKSYLIPKNKFQCPIHNSSRYKGKFTPSAIIWKHQTCIENVGLALEKPRLGPRSSFFNPTSYLGRSHFPVQIDLVDLRASAYWTVPKVQVRLIDLEPVRQWTTAIFMESQKKAISKAPIYVFVVPKTDTYHSADEPTVNRQNNDIGCDITRHLSMDCLSCIDSRGLTNLGRSCSAILLLTLCDDDPWVIALGRAEGYPHNR